MKKGSTKKKKNSAGTVADKALKVKSAGEIEKMKGKDYDKELEKLHIELVKLQEWVKFFR